MLPLQAYFSCYSAAKTAMEAALEEEDEEGEGSQPPAIVPAALFSSGLLEVLLEGAMMQPLQAQQVCAQAAAG